MILYTRNIILMLLFSLSAFTAKGLTAGFTASPTAGCAPLVVCFTNTSSPSTGTTYDWDLANGSGILHLVNPCGSYLTPGTYTVTLTAHNGSSSSTHTQIITVYPAPTVHFTSDFTAVCPGSPVTFTSTTIGGVPGPITYAWAFGDGFAGSGSPVSHSYSSSGYKNVTLTATNADGCVASLTVSSYIQVYTRPTAAFLPSSSHFCKPPANATFTAFPAGAGPFTYSWTFGDGSAPSSLPTPGHTYAATGTYTVRLVVTDAHGCVDSSFSNVTVGDLHAAFTSPATACINTVVTFPNTSSAHLSSTWNYGDGYTGGTETGAHMYTTAGTYNVTLIIYDGFCHDTVTHTIIILPAATASFTVTPTQPCPAPATVTLSGTAPPGSTVGWLYGDGGTGTGITSVHTYATNGCFNIGMIVVNASGCIDTIFQNFCIYDLFFGISPAIDTAGCAPLTVNFTTYHYTTVPGPGLAPYPFGIASYSWTFGDGSPGSTGPTPVHIYTAPGSYIATVSIITANGCIATSSIMISVGTPPVISVSAAPRHLCYRGNIVNFTSTVIVGPVDNYDWVFGDGSGASGPSSGISHHYAMPGTFSVTITPSYHGCYGPVVVLTNYIVIDSPQARLGSKVLCYPVNRVVFGDSSLGDDTHVWIFGDGSPTSTLDNPVHDYPLPIIYTVTLATYNIASGCRDTITQLIDLHRPVPTFTTPDTAICRDDFITFTPFIIGGSASSYYWHSSGWSADSTFVTYTDTFHSTGIFSIRLIIMDQNGCFDTAVRTNYILVAKPVAHFTVSPATGCLPLYTVFSDASTDVAGTFYTNFNWSFGDGGIGSTGSPGIGHTFTTVGTFASVEIVTDNVGCKDTVTLPLVTVYHPTAAFNISNTHPCIGTVALFNNTSTSGTSYYWWFGDGATSTTSPNHVYTATGTFTVKLAVTDVHGCSDTVTHVGYISVTKPVAAFSMSDSLSICPPLTVHFTNMSTGAWTYNWNLGDGSTTTIANPTDLYISTGYDTVRLIATNLYGCSDTAYGHITMFGYAGAFNYTPDSGCTPLQVFFVANTSNVPNIIWDFADGNTSLATMSDTISHVYTIPGAYVPKLILSDNTGCQNSSLGIDTIKVDGIAAGFTTNPNPVCLGETINLVDTSFSYWSVVNSWNWTYEGTTSTLASPSVTYTAVGTYPVTLQVTDGWGCAAALVHDVTVYLPPVITISPDTIICLGDAATLHGYGGVSYTWAGPGAISCISCNPTLVSPLVVSQYTVTGTDAVGCSNTDTTSVLLKTLTVSRAWNDTAICRGESTPLFDTGGNKYTWVPGIGLSDPFSADPIATPGTSMRYMAIAQMGSCKPDTNYVNVVVWPLPFVDAGPDQRLLAGSVAQLSASGNLIDKLLWTPGNTISCDTCPAPLASMTVTTTYIIRASTIHGCLNYDTVIIHLYCDNSQLFIPNSFTPNGNGENDVFYPRGKGVSIIKSFRIYNRWGEMMFERSGIQLNDAGNAWDGTFNGGAPRADVYVWVIDALCDTGEPLFLKGDVTIIR
jgi:gliding motility-associated-like protein